MQKAYLPGKVESSIIFHASGPALFSWLPQVASTARIVVTSHGLDWSRAKWGRLSSFLLRNGERTAVRFADEIIVVSEALQTYFHESHGRESVYIPNAPASYPPSDPDFAYGHSLKLQPGKYILFLGRLVPEKRPDLLIQAFQALKPSGWKLVLVGGGSDTNEYASQLIDQVGSDEAIVFTGELWGARLAEIVRGAGLFVLPSDIEGMPLALLEAMQERIPVIVSNIPIHQSLVAEHGLLFEAGDLSDCSQKLDWALQHPLQMQQMAETAQQFVQKNYNWDRIAAEVLSIYTRLCAEPQKLCEPSYPIATPIRSLVPR